MERKPSIQERIENTKFNIKTAAAGLVFGATGGGIAAGIEIDLLVNHAHNRVEQGLTAIPLLAATGLAYLAVEALANRSAELSALRTVQLQEEMNQSQTIDSSPVEIFTDTPTRK